MWAIATATILAKNKFKATVEAAAELNCLPFQTFAISSGTPECVLKQLISGHAADGSTCCRCVECRDRDSNSRILATVIVADAAVNKSANKRAIDADPPKKHSHPTKEHTDNSAARRRARRAHLQCEKRRICHAFPSGLKSPRPRRSPPQPPRPHQSRPPHRPRADNPCVSGSPKRALNSSTSGPSAVSIRPAYRHAAKRRPAPRHLVQHRRDARSTTCVQRSASSDRRAGSTRPCRRCWGRCRRRRRACGPRGRQRAHALAVAEGEHAKAPRPQPLLDQHPRSGAPKPSLDERAHRRARLRGRSQTMTPLPAARPSAFTTTWPSASAIDASRRATACRRPRTRGGHARRVHHRLGERLRALDRAAAAGAGRSRRSRPRSAGRPGRPPAAPPGRPRPGRRASRRASSVRPSRSHRRRRRARVASCAMPGLPGAACRSPVERGAGERPGQGMLAATGSDEEDSHRGRVYYRRSSRRTRYTGIRARRATR